VTTACGFTAIVTFAAIVGVSWQVTVSRSLINQSNRPDCKGSFRPFDRSAISPGEAYEPYNDVVRIFLAGASGVIGQRLIPRLVQAGHIVGGLTRSASKTELVSHLGAEPILCDVFDREALMRVVLGFKPDVLLNELTDLPDDAAQITKLTDRNARIRTEGNRNLIAAARRSGSPKILAQSVAWQLPDGPAAQAVAELERSVLTEGGVVLRYGQFYGPGTYHEQQPPEEPRVHIDRAAERTVEVLNEPTGVVVITD
jgi:NAD dependent epimerase/dehydratase family